MIRTVIPSILLFLLPFAVYFLWLRLRRRDDADATLAPGKLLWVALVGALLAFGAFMLFVDTSGAPPDSIYVPPHYEDGKIVPGHFEPHRKAD